MLKGLSSILKKAVQVAAPIFGSTLTPFAPGLGAAVGSGLAGLLSGQKPKDALVSAGISGLAGQMGLLGGGKGSTAVQTGGSNTQRVLQKDLRKPFLENFRMPSIFKDGKPTGFGTALGVGLPSVLAYMGAAADAKRAQPMDPADYMSATDKFYGGQFARPPEELRIKNLNSIIQQPQGRAEGGLMGTEFAYSAYDGSPMGIQTMADGGETFPRKTGQISGPGGPKDDKIPAMLSDGEFVFTAKAVDNAGGPKAMYKMMNRLDPESERPN
jgi:hypothetical protein